jgi:undecaprenyl-diphosphatase
MAIVSSLAGWGHPGTAFEAVIQIGTLAAVLTYFWRDVVRILAAMLADLRRGKLATTHDAQMGWMIAVGTLPIIACGLLFEKQINTSLQSLYVMAAALAGVALLLGAAEIIVRRRRAGGRSGREVDQLSWRDAIIMGFAQACALVPGTSRSGATILGGLASGLNREAAARFSFLLSIPSVFAAGVYKLVTSHDELLASSSQVGNLVVALIVTTIVGYATIPWLLGFLRRRSMFVFIVYRLVLAALLLMLLSNGWLSDS